MIHLDTNYLVSGIQTGPPEELTLTAWLNAKEALGISSVAWAEFFCGPIARGADQIARKMFKQVEALTDIDAELAADLFNKTGRRSKTLADCMIAAVAIRCGAKLATINRADFQPFVPHGLLLV